MAGVRNQSGKELWATECWYTLNVIPGGNPNPVRVLAYSRTTGFRHDSIPEALQAIKGLSGVKVEATEDPAAFTLENLKRFDVVAFVNTTGDVLDTNGKRALEGFVKGGGGWIGVHSASDTEYGWPFYNELVGAMFESHPPGVHKAMVTVEDRGHATTSFLPPMWERTDEWYDFKTNPRTKAHVLATIDEKTYTGGKMGRDHPVAWCHEVGQGRSWYTAFGHTKESWSEPLVREMVRTGILWAAKR
ncbi:ThuA domain-containing protein [bacterium]|nr:MAG: ThuA domain-containing protein [bacterium]